MEKKTDTMNGRLGAKLNNLLAAVVNVNFYITLSH